MRLLSVRLIASLIVGITVVSLGFSYYEVVKEKRVLRSDLERRAEVLGESVAGNVEKSWDGGSNRGLQRLVQRFGNREHLLGVGVYDRRGNVVAITSELGKIITAIPPDVTQAMETAHGEASFIRLGDDRVHIFALPVHRQDQIVGGLAVVHDVDYIRVFLKRHHSHEEIERYYCAADLCLVTALHDGMNLVAKEFLAARRDERGVLILSQFTGAARELSDALLVNPYDIDQTAEAIRVALEMEPEEKQLRVRRMRKVIKEQNIYRWAGSLITELCELRLDGTDHSPEKLRGSVTAA